MNLPINKNNSKESIKSTVSNKKESNGKVNIPKLQIDNVNNPVLIQNDSLIEEKMKSDSIDSKNKNNTFYKRT